MKLNMFNKLCLLIVALLFAIVVNLKTKSICKLTSSNLSLTLNKAALKMDFMHYIAVKKQIRKEENEKFKFKSKSDPQLTQKYHLQSDGLLEDWFAISSIEFHNTARYPAVPLPNGNFTTITTDVMDYRINKAQCSITSNYRVPKPSDDNRLFFFSFSSCRIVYTATPTDVNVLEIFDIKKEFKDIQLTEDYSGENLFYCMSLTSNDSGKNWRICGENEEKVKKWVCMSSACIDTESNFSFCFTYETDKEKTKCNYIKQTIILIPLPSPTCNKDWNYLQKGLDWGCVCKEGQSQSPIDLPKKEDAIDSPITPIFSYSLISKYMADSIEGSQHKGNLKIQNWKHLHILHDDLGRITTQDGTIYQAQEITFHTPSNHKIDGKQFDLEVTILHSGITKGDIAKQVSLSFLFEGSPGAYNKFFDDIDIFNLPNPFTKEVELLKDLFLPKILYQSDEEGIELKPFSHYTYEGSLTYPPCTEQTIIYVASKPLKLSTTTIALFKEALRKPDLYNSRGLYFSSPPSYGSKREIQSINGRPIFHYEACEKEKVKISQEGHYEKVKDKSILFFYVNGDKPSGVPGAMVVTKNEALGIINH